jgi:hypothetical protein
MRISKRIYNRYILNKKHFMDFREIKEITVIDIDPKIIQFCLDGFIGK